MTTSCRQLNEAKHWMWHAPEQHRRTRVNAQASWATVSRMAFEACGLTLSESTSTALALTYLSQLIDHLQLLPGARETLAEWQKRGVRLALVTNGDGRIQRQKLARHNLAGYFDALVFESDSPAGKPDAAIYRLALEQLRAAPTEAWMAGDNLEFDVAGPQRVGLRAAWVDRSGKGLPAGSTVKPDRIVQSVAELLDQVLT